MISILRNYKLNSPDVYLYCYLIETRGFPILIIHILNESHSLKWML